MERFIEAFFTPYYMMTAVDSLIVAGTLGGLSLFTWYLATRIRGK